MDRETKLAFLNVGICGALTFKTYRLISKAFIMAAGEDASAAKIILCKVAAYALTVPASNTISKMVDSVFDAAFKTTYCTDNEDQNGNETDDKLQSSAGE